MTKKILAIFFVSILLCSYIIPTTSAFADVVIGDNDSIVVTQQGIENGKKIATMEAMLQLLESGVSEINFNEISDLDEYLEDFYDELTNVNYQDVSNELLAGAYNDVKQLKQWIDDRGDYIATYYRDYLNSADEGLSNIFNEFQLKLPKSQLVGTTLNGFKGMSRFNRGVITPDVNPDVNYQTYLNNINGSGFWFKNYSNTSLSVNGVIAYVLDYYPASLNSWVCDESWNLFGNSPTTMYYLYPSDIIDLYITKVGSNYSLSYNYTSPTMENGRCNVVANNSSFGQSCNFCNIINGQFSCTSKNAPNVYSKYFSSSGSLNTVFNYIMQRFKNVNIYVDGVCWSYVGQGTNPPTLDIDGFLTMYNNANPVEYEFPQGTQIDYNALYTTIYNAIRDNLPLDMQIINNNQVYYDSHDTVYSPTIYNYYGKDGDDENDWIDSILDYATIPDFNSVLGTVAVLDTPFVNGITIVNAGVTDVIPTDILLILGGFFVLVLFVCIINRMSE